jgi:hypothetical protein
MSILGTDVEPLAIDVEFPADMLHVTLKDGREIAAPLDWFPRLQKATARERKNWQLIGGGLGIRWDEIDEDISVESLLRLR